MPRWVESSVCHLWRCPTGGSRSRDIPFWKYIHGPFQPCRDLGFPDYRAHNEKAVLLYIPAEVMGALLASLFVKHAIGNEAFLGANSPNYAYPLPLVFGVEVMASALLMAVILTVVFTKGLRGFGGLAYWRDCWLGHILFRALCQGRQ